MSGRAAPLADDYPVGSSLPPVTRRVTREMIRAYAEASGDRNPIHLDEEFAKSVGLPGVIAHGLLSFAFLGAYLAAWAGDPGRVRSLSARFAAPVLPGDDVTCTAQVVAIERDGALDRVTLKVEGVNQRGERVLSRGQAVVELPRAGGRAEGGAGSDSTVRSGAEGGER